MLEKFFNFLSNNELHLDAKLKSLFLLNNKNNQIKLYLVK